MGRMTVASGLAAAGLALASLTLVASAAAATTSPAQGISANVSSGPFTIQVDAQRAAGAPAGSATGDFTAHGALGSLPLFTLRGPVTCLDVRGNRAGLFYPIRSSDPAVFAKLGSGVFVYFQVSASGKPQLLGFLPVPRSSTTSCAPGLALFAVTAGTVVLTS